MQRFAGNTMSKAKERQSGVMETTVNGVVYEEVITTQSIEDFSE